MSEQEIAQAAVAMGYVKPDPCDELPLHIRRSRFGCMACREMAEWEGHLARVRATLPILRPKGSVLIGGTCKDCVFSRTGVGPRGEALWCHNSENPIHCVNVSPDFGCVLYQRRET